MSKHTPGPWQIGKNFGSVVCDTPVPGIRGSDDTEYYGGHLIAESVTEANARLIAAAPELLEACKVALGIIGFGAEHDQISAAIAKATGEPA